MSKQSILFLGSKPIGYHCLHYLIQQQEKSNFEIVGLLTNDNPIFSDKLSLKTLAQVNHIPIIDSLDTLPEVDIIYSVQYHELLKPVHIAKAKNIAVNLHMAPLPELRGCNQFSFAIAEQRKIFGTSIHKIDASIDHGDILFEKRFPIPDNCWVQDLYQRTFDASLDLFIESLDALLTNQFTPIPQSSLLQERGTSIHYRHEITQLKEIDLDWPQEKIANRIRATYMPGFEPPYAMIDGKKMYFTQTWQ